jgi:succinoglycan biosynthesis transport protein ExoP
MVPSISKVQAQINNEISLAHHQVQDEYENSLHVEDAVRKRLAAQEDAAYRLNEDAAQYSILRHQAEATRELYDTLEMKLKEASVTAGMSAANITVVDRADVPFIPVAPQKRQALMYGLVGGILFGCVLAFVIESIDDRLSTSEEVENASMLPSLAAIPHFSYGQERRKGEAREEVGSGALQTARQLITLHDPKSNGAEPCNCACAKGREGSAGGRRPSARKLESGVRDYGSDLWPVGGADPAWAEQRNSRPIAGIANVACSYDRTTPAESSRDAFF